MYSLEVFGSKQVEINKSNNKQFKLIMDYIKEMKEDIGGLKKDLKNLKEQKEVGKND